MSVQRQCSQDAAAAEELLQGRKSYCRSGRATAPDESGAVPFIKLWQHSQSLVLDAKTLVFHETVYIFMNKRDLIRGIGRLHD